MSSKEMFEKLGYECFEDDGITTYRKGDYIPDKLNTKYVQFREIGFNRLSRKISIYDYKKNAECTDLLDNATDMKINILNVEELKAINKQAEELGWLNDRRRS